MTARRKSSRRRTKRKVAAGKRSETGSATGRALGRPPVAFGPPSVEQQAYFLEARIKRYEYPPATARGGKWLLFVARKDVDEVWAKVLLALREGRLGDFAKVSTARPNPHAADPDKHVVCVYTYDSEDREDVVRIRAALRELGFIKPIAYKTDAATHAGRYEVRGHGRIAKYYE
jgi:hypothetical protein